MNSYQARKRQEATEARKAMRKYYIGGVILAILIVAVIILNSSLMLTGISAVTVGNTSYSAAEFNYYYYNAYYSNATLASYMGLDTSRPWDSQEYTEGTTWKDFFQASGLETLTTVTARYDAAIAAGYTLTEDDQVSIEETFTALEEAAATNNMSMKQFLVARYGKGMTEDILRKLLEQETIAAGYYNQILDSHSYTQAELDAEYANLADSQDRITYSYYLVPAVAETDENGEETYSESAIADAVAEAEALVSGLSAHTPEALETAVSALDAEATPTTTTLAGSSLDAAYSEWLLDAARSTGDITTAETSNGCYVVLFQSRDNNSANTVNVRHILIRAEADEEGAYTDEAKAAALEKAEEILQEWRDGEATEESFAALAEEYSEDSGSNTNGGLYEQVYPGQMVTEFNDFCFAENRAPGDVEIVFNEGSYCGYHVIYFVGEDAPYRDLLAENSLNKEAMSAWDAEISEGYTHEIGFGMKFAM